MLVYQRVPGEFERKLDVLYMGMGQNPGTPGEPQNSWVKMDVNNPLKMVLIGIDP